MIDADKVLNGNSYISIGIMVLIIGVCVWLNNKFNEINVVEARLDGRLTTMESIKVMDRWSSTDMFKWAIHLQQTNPTVKVPEPKHEE